MAGAEVELVPLLAREYRLRQALRATRNYDTVLVDCPPSLGLLTINALTAGDAVIIPVQCEYYALEGLAQLLATIDAVRARLNNQLDVLAIVLTMEDRRNRLSLSRSSTKSGATSRTWWLTPGSHARSVSRRPP